jgi:DNA mismatch endonuclease (patch repair protein)
MALVRGENTGPEMVVRRALHAAGLRYVLHDKRLPGRPDIVLPSRRCVVEVRGCFWHRHPDPLCPLTRTPKTRLEFWQGKFGENVARDRRNDAALADLGWKLILVWECELARHGPGPVVEAVRALPVQSGRPRWLPRPKSKTSTNRKARRG